MSTVGRMDEDSPSTSATTTLWTVTPSLILAIDAALGAPVDSYLNGSQVWLTPDGPNEAMLEWRLHPVGAFRLPAGISHYDIWEHVVSAFSRNEDDAEGAFPPGDLIVFGDESRALTSLWTGFECFAAYGDKMTPAALAAATTSALSVAPELSGTVNHRAIADEWVRTGRAADLAALVRSALAPS